MNDMESAVSDAIIAGSTQDPVLIALLDLTIASIRDERPVFSPLDEPVLYRYFRKFTKKALDGKEKIDNFMAGEIFHSPAQENP